MFEPNFYFSQNNKRNMRTKSSLFVAKIAILLFSELIKKLLSISSFISPPFPKLLKAVRFSFMNLSNIQADNRLSDKH